MKTYSIVVEWCEGGGDYVAYSPEFPLLFHYASTRGDALSGIESLLGEEISQKLLEKVKGMS